MRKEFTVQSRMFIVGGGAESISFLFAEIEAKMHVHSFNKPLIHPVIPLIT